MVQHLLAPRKGKKIPPRRRGLFEPIINDPIDELGLPCTVHDTTSTTVFQHMTSYFCLVQRAWAAVADAAIRIQQNGVPAHLAQLTAACNTHNVALTTQQAQTVLVAKGNPNPVGHGLAELAEPSCRFRTSAKPGLCWPR